MHSALICPVRSGAPSLAAASISSPVPSLPDTQRTNRIARRGAVLGLGIPDTSAPHTAGSPTRLIIPLRRQKADNRVCITQALTPRRSPTPTSINRKCARVGCERHSLELRRFLARLNRVNAERAFTLQLLRIRSRTGLRGLRQRQLVRLHGRIIMRACVRGPARRWD
jgi:hypothetical protein